MKSRAAKRNLDERIAPGAIIESAPPPPVADRLDYIAAAAYYKAEARGFRPGQELDDWLQAEAECSTRKLQ